MLLASPCEVVVSVAPKLTDVTGSLLEGDAGAIDATPDWDKRLWNGPRWEGGKHRVILTTDQGELQGIAPQGRCRASQREAAGANQGV